MISGDVFGDVFGEFFGDVFGDFFGDFSSLTGVVGDLVSKTLKGSVVSSAASLLDSFPSACSASNAAFLSSACRVGGERRG